MTTILGISKGRPRGSSALRANSDVMILCTPSHESAGNVAALTQYKNRSADKTKYRVHLISKQVDLGKREGEDIVNLSFSASSPRDDEETPAKAKGPAIQGCHPHVTAMTEV